MPNQLKAKLYFAEKMVTQNLLEKKPKRP